MAGFSGIFKRTTARPVLHGSLIYFPFFHIDNLMQRLQASAAVAVIGKLFAVCLFGLLQFIPALQSG